MPDEQQAWAKVDRETGDTHHLAHHMADVAAVFLALAELPVWRVRLERAAGRPLTAQEVERLAVLVFLHDAGKLFSGFQAKGWPKGAWRQRLCGHVSEGARLFLRSDPTLDPAATSLHVDALDGWGVSCGMLLGVMAHHGRPLDMERDVRVPTGEAAQGWDGSSDYDPLKAAQAIGTVMPQWFPRAFAPGGGPLPDRPEFEHFLSGMCALADWIGSDSRFFPFVPSLDTGYWPRVRAQAAAAVEAIGLVTAPAQHALDQDGPVSFHRLTGFEAANPAQAVVGAADVSASLLILEAETGSGKTEASLWRFARLFQAGRVDGLYFAVPTRAAAVQLHARVCKVAERLFGPGLMQPVLALPGYLRIGEHEGRALPDWQVLWDDDPEAILHARRWAAEHATRFLAAPIAVGTVDQAMLATVCAKHAHLRGSALARTLLVIDEVHASDAYMTKVQQHLVAQHRALGGYAMLMSATLGSAARSSWLGSAQPAQEDAATTPYPAVWTETRLEPSVPEHDGETPARTKSVAMQELPSMAPEPTAEAAIVAARQGARVLVIRNTVARAVETLQTVEAALGDPEHPTLFRVSGVSTLHHSRFAPVDRAALDATVEAVLSTDKQREPGGRIVIGTQTVEQSLDIDADLLITDLCPVDVLLQRIGRLHRHELPRPEGFETPRCVVLTRECGLAELLAPAFDNGLGARETPGGIEGVYTDLAILELTARLVRAHPVWDIPHMNRRLVEAATHPAAMEALIAELGPAWEQYQSRVLGREIAQLSSAGHVLLRREQRFETLTYPSNEEAVRTRLGAEGARLQFVEPFLGPFGLDIESIVIPHHMCPAPDLDVAPELLEKSPPEAVFAWSGGIYHYDRLGLHF
ncbi:MAG: CRISPR-associated helicase Cas3' [Pseudomonadota bacterium]